MKSTIFNLVLTVFLLWFTIQIESSYEMYLAYFFILTIGIIHGANDISLITYLTKTATTSKIKYLLFYISLIGIMSVAFFLLPFIALLVFIAFSCYHFGEQHFYGDIHIHNSKSTLLYIAYGVLIFGLLFYTNAFETSAIIQELTGVQITENNYLTFLIIGALFTVVSLFLNRFNFKDGINYYQELFLILVFFMLFKLASLLWAFAIYFIVWHSLPSLRDQTSTLYGRFDKQSFLKYIKSSLLNWIISIVGLALVYYVSLSMSINFITLFFAFLAAITIPHVIVMYFLNKK